jgi:hypothetical protein
MPIETLPERYNAGVARGPAASFVGGLVALLRGEATDRQIAAAIVAGELGVHEPAVVSALASLAESGVAPLQIHAAEALGRLAAKRALPSLMPLLAARDEGVRRAAANAVAAMGPAALPALEARLAAPGLEPSERHALEEALARLGGKEALAALLGGLDMENVEAARAAVLAARPRIKNADARERRAYMSEVQRFLARKAARASTAATVAGLRLFGYLEDESAVPLLLAHAADRKGAEEARVEALIALRFLARARNPRAAAAAAGKLLAIAETAPPGVARTALYTMASLAIPASLAARLGKLAAHDEAERGLLATERLGQIPGPAASEALGRALAEARDRARAEAAAQAIAGRPDAAATLARGLLAASDDADRAAMLARLLRPHTAALDTKTARALRDAALARLGEGRPGWQPLLQAAREADAPGTAAALRATAERLRKSKRAANAQGAMEAMRALARSAEATPEDGYRLAALELLHGRRDEAFTIFGQLLDRGFDLAAALARDRALDLEARYQIGFHLAERRQPAGEEVLAAVAEAGGRAKVAKMARAKLKSLGV